MSTKKIYLEPVWKPHSLYNSMISYPPEGYEIVANLAPDNRLFRAASKYGISYTILQDWLEKVIPSVLIRSRMQKFKRAPQDTILTYATGHLVFRDEPWIVDMEYIGMLTGYNAKYFRKFRILIQNTLASQNCKKIICWSEAAKNTVLENLDCSRIEHKLEVLPFAVMGREFIKNQANGKIKLLFVNSGNIPLQFHYKGGKEILEAYKILSAKYDNIEMVVRSDIPAEFREKCSGMRNLRIIDKVIPWEELEQEFKSADIFLYPTHSSQDIVVLDAMSYELPIVISDVFANAEVVKDEKTGYVIPRSEHVPYYVDGGNIAGGTPEFKKAIKTSDPKVVEALVNKTSILIENPELRKQMGKAGRWEIEYGKFSIENRNQKLKRIFDEATVDLATSRLR